MSTSALMFQLSFIAARKRRRWWVASRAEVFAWLDADTADAARAEAAAEMDRRGWTIERFGSSQFVDPDLPLLAPLARVEMRRASPGAGAYTFYRAPAPSASFALESGPICSRYLDSPGVRLDPARIPEPLRPLLRFAAEWVILDDVERQRFIASVSADRKKEFVDAVVPQLDEIERYAAGHVSTVPVPDEVIVLNALAEAADEAADDVGR